VVGMADMGMGIEWCVWGGVGCGVVGCERSVLYVSIPVIEFPFSFFYSVSF
jgi:hypothetical protein